MRRHPVSFGLLLVLAGLLFTHVALARDISRQLALILDEPLAGRLQTGILRDRVLPLAAMESYDGGPRSRPVTVEAWRQMYSEIRRASVAPPSQPALEEVRQRGLEAGRRGVLPIAIMNFRYETIRNDALESGALIIREGRLEVGEGDPLVLRRLFAATPLTGRTYRGGLVVFRLNRELFFTNDPAGWQGLDIDFDDGQGFLPAVLDRDYAVRYTSTGLKTIRLRLTMDSGEMLLAASRFDVRALETPLPDDTLHITAAIPYAGQFGTGEAYVYLADQHAAIANPAVLLEGFDLDNSMNWDELYELLNREQLIEEIRNRGFDAVVLNFTDATDYIQRNAFVAVELIQQIKGIIDPAQDMALAGASMGGLVGRYALAYMETNGLEHRVRNFIAFDAPQGPANIPLGLQYWIWFFADQSTEAEAFLAALNSPAARQLLGYHFTDPPASTGATDPLRGVLLDELSGMGEYPSLPRKAAIINGSAAQVNQGFQAGDQLIQWEYTSFLVDITGNVWAVPDAGSHIIFDGLIDIILLPSDEAQVVVADTRPYDSAPGGWRSSQADLDATQAPYGDIVALHPNHCFIPTISSLALQTEDLFYNVAGDPNILDISPFDVVYFPMSNQEHVEITPENKEWILAELEYGVADVAMETPGFSPVAGIGPAVPNPFRAEARLRFLLPRNGPVQLGVWDVAGRRVASLVDGDREAGEHQMIWDGLGANGRRLPPGLYFMLLKGEGFAATRKVQIR
ncbi:MAG: hypothetical protein KJ970_20845 [Candidatus Eisenbacteria bacterium]|uniref:FlgD/Vpr Ig-like domain-containing protein n=1 Tax=Eiseniibacteriota bacterium TaxID=2212470 RepID=A0A948RYW4_UNCEI|nr:hypothetical protein [Candidatus Eisenbacteria bacterium]MBU2693375.1 hypothetical protein [Candidatus Eisenbacteria bacterium]